ncbi:MAG TPA: SCO1664 family protein, partial [Vicinamibacterales bacterium]|nr:SCO1664 family protein [Vicinamibacterales bacterium]
SGRLEILGRLVDASNATFVCRLEGSQRVVYKPVRGERPLDDFPSRTLANREVAAFVLSEATGWAVVPPTVMRDGPLGPGMVQQWVDVDPEVDVLSLIVADDPRLRRICLFDVLANNADRKGGHLLPAPGGHIYGVDHGICFAEDPKLRTVLWGWRGKQLTDEESVLVESVCSRLNTDLGESLAELLSPDEVLATARRASRLAGERRFPQPDPSRPALPWPPF